ncbi:MAG: radical SAM family heme chaperone HemW [Bdellovibrionota bacterium]
MTVQTESLYIHFPFCEKKCHYCDFYSLSRPTVATEEVGRFIGALKQEILNSSDYMCCKELKTIFLGGGTPTMLNADHIERAVEPLLNFLPETSDNTEWTIEANPSSITLDKLKAYLKLGINRISIGVQSLDPKILSWLGRLHTKEKALNAVAMAFDAGFTNVSVDLLCGIPNQPLKTLEKTFLELLKFPIVHISCYLLTLGADHKLSHELPDTDEQLKHFLWVHNFLNKNGFEHYEVSNFALNGWNCRHNLTYWKGLSYLGLGPSSHSFDSKSKRRWKNFSSLDRYNTALLTGESPIEWAEKLTSNQLHLEKWMLALRLGEGFPISWLSEKQKIIVSALEKDGFIEEHPSVPSNKRLTSKGLAISDQIVISLV